MSVVIKYGGNAMTDSAVRNAVAASIAKAAAAGRRPVVVHGGGPFIEEQLEHAGVATHFVRGMRVTTDEAIEHVEVALTLLGKRLAQEIGVAVGLTGRDNHLIRAQVLDPDLGRVGRVTSVNAEMLTSLLDVGLTPVVACLGVDDAGLALNVNADLVAGAVAAALAVPVVFLTNVAGVLDDPEDRDSRLPTLTRGEVDERIRDGRISGGMIPKVESALAAIELGATSAVIASGMEANGLERALSGLGGTRILRE